MVFPFRHVHDIYYWIFPIEMPSNANFHGRILDSIGFFPMRVGYPKSDKVFHWILSNEIQMPHSMYSQFVL